MRRFLNVVSKSLELFKAAARVGTETEGLRLASRFSSVPAIEVGGYATIVGSLSTVASNISKIENRLVNFCLFELWLAFESVRIFLFVVFLWWWVVGEPFVWESSKRRPQLWITRFHRGW